MIDPIDDPSNLKLYLPKTENAIVDAFEMAVASFQVASKIEGAKFYIPPNAEILNTNNTKPEDPPSLQTNNENSLDQSNNLPKFNILDRRPIDKPVQSQGQKPRPVLKEKSMQKENKTEKERTKSQDKQQSSKTNKSNREEKNTDTSDTTKPNYPNKLYIPLTNAFPSEPPSMQSHSIDQQITFPPPIPVETDPIRNHMLHAWYWAGYYTGLADAQRNQNNLPPK
ncbi:hypothetical protein TVAG_060510 [Trichomonas vaginalis G3]|uniref:Survival motor neuron Tudor domain-containing protein n=1 Tax=Trichomonas vaginalis (strain ATCC PRA-98 / G3) TaxID=412133 RepID=A2ECI0_TRIV3|nr:hypothetical protein TVAGG3_0311880 [Trichomonas vaginalis G3]EAY09675.1 hypothetical protein TVAG_060510 [Trichomonas vaginalis G3]KAI5528676.1 hypothetical protein TVAGG3_0311880 [Trichomonas vaginalis G3]|eukprot:XP_001321898.1 hypothetical protein [Trichomonas vaginalis G3]